MKTKIIALLILFSFCAIAQEHSRGDRNIHPGDLSLHEVIFRISSNFEKLEREYLTKLSYRDYIRAKSLLMESYDLLNSIPTEENEEYIDNKPISSEDFIGLLQSIQNESFAEDKLGVVSIASKYHYFLVDQVLRIIDEFSFSSNKIEIIKLVYPNVIDKENSHKLISAFTFSSDKDKVREIIKSFPGN
ncbi:MAG TPA: hypothetical protein DHV28_01425 [Ignavibacteriales bacterium]|nr:hypothetical protein [Ignavibacteriales bacterium]